MKIICRCPKGIKKGLADIHFVDKCLCVIMIVLLVQSAYSIFHQGNVNGDILNIDVIVRTAAASIFGYFLSANFILRESKEDTGGTSHIHGGSRDVGQPANSIQKHIGFHPAGNDMADGNRLLKQSEKPGSLMPEKPGSPIPDTTDRPESAVSDIPDKPVMQAGDIEEPDKKDLSGEKVITYKLQVIIATFICLFCLITLLLVRNVPFINGNVSNSSSITATLAQFRDFVSGCIGFLIGCPTATRSK